jgi:hypothetical protein
MEAIESTQAAVAAADARREKRPGQKLRESQYSIRRLWLAACAVRAFLPAAN